MVLRAELFCFFTRAAPGHGSAVVAVSRNGLNVGRARHQERQVPEQSKKKNKNHVSRA